MKHPGGDDTADKTESDGEDNDKRERILSHQKVVHLLWLLHDFL
jgi:hypothetical protein